MGFQLFKISKNFLLDFYLFIFVFGLIFFSLTSYASENENSWEAILNKSSGDTVFFHAWGGDKNINSYIKWASDEIKKKYNISVKHVKVSDTSNVVARILSEKNARKNTNGAVDLVWINGENFSMMKNNGLLLNQNWIFKIPNSKFLDFENNPNLLNDFGVDTEGMEMPWGLVSTYLLF
jgi:putative thiamine transport system substrate-binding protein